MEDLSNARYWRAYRLLNRLGWPIQHSQSVLIDRKQAFAEECAAYPERAKAGNTLAWPRLKAIDVRLRTLRKREAVVRRELDAARVYMAA